MLEEVDAAVGQIVDALAEQNLAQKTLILFTSDNGRARGEYGNPSLRGHKYNPVYAGE